MTLKASSACYNDNVACSNKDCPTLSRKNKLFQKRYKRVLEVLSSKPLSFNEVVEQSGLNSRYAKHCLDFLVSQGKVDRVPEDCRGARGRPRVFYSISSQTNQLQLKSSANIEVERPLTPKKSKSPSTVAVEVDFNKLKAVCKHGKGGNCNQKLKQGTFEKCTLSKCPLVLHIRLADK